MIPFTDNSAHVTDDFCTERRLAETIRFIHPVDFYNRTWLDVGEPNHVCDRIEEIVYRKAEHTLGDLNARLIGVVGDGYRVVTCFEVVEHIMNPLNLMLSIRYYMASGGVLYLSTPVHNRFGFYFNETNHFTEYKESSLRTLVEYAGFKITDYHQFKSIPFWQGMKQGGGLFRTALRVSSQRTQILRAVKI